MQKKHVLASELTYEHVDHFSKHLAVSFSSSLPTGCNDNPCNVEDTQARTEQSGWWTKVSDPACPVLCWRDIQCINARTCISIIFYPWYFMKLRIECHSALWLEAVAPLFSSFKTLSILSYLISDYHNCLFMSVKSSGVCLDFLECLWHRLWFGAWDSKAYELSG